MARTAGFHAGELAAQRNAQEQDIAARNSANVANHIIRGALPFVRQQTTLYVGSIDQQGRVWASMLFGAAGFLQPSEDAHTLLIDLQQVAIQARDPLWENLKHDGRLGLLLLETQSRRRLKINGSATLTDGQLSLQIEESVPICPRYIQRRSFSLSDPGQQPMPDALQDGLALGTEQLLSISSADTFFLASTHATHGSDCSHRGGPPGFVQVLENGVLRIPDYNGNSMFNSFGNFLLDPQAGLLFPDYQRRVMLQLNGTVEVFWDQADDDGLTAGTGRFWEFTVERWLETALPAALRTDFVDYSPFLPKGK